MWESQLVRILRRRLEQASQRNPGFSLRAFARRLGLSPGALSEIMRRKRGVSAEKALDIVSRLGLSEAEALRFRNLLLRDQSDSMVTIKGDAFELIARWYYPAIISLFNLDQPPQSEEEVAEALALDLAVAKDAIQRLINFRLLRREEDGRVVSTGMHFSTEEDVPSEAIRRAHIDGLDIAAQALHKYQVNEREFTSIVFDASQVCIDEAKSEIRQFRDSLSQMMKGPERDTVYRLNIQLFPLNRPAAQKVE